LFKKLNFNLIKENEKNNYLFNTYFICHPHDGAATSEDELSGGSKRCRQLVGHQSERWRKD